MSSSHTAAARVRRASPRISDSFDITNSIGLTEAFCFTNGISEPDGKPKPFALSKCVNVTIGLT